MDRAVFTIGQFALILIIINRVNRKLIKQNGELKGMDTSYFSATNSSSDISNKTAENIYNFNDFSNENYLLFIENLKLEMNNALHKDYSNELLVSRVKINYL